MAHSRKKLVAEYKGLLRERIQRTKEIEKGIFDCITDVSKQALEDSRGLLEETDKKLFLKRYQDISSQLEICMNKLLMYSSKLPSQNGDSTTSSSSSSSESDEDDDEGSLVTSLTKSSQSSHHSQKSPSDSKKSPNDDSKSSKDESDNNKKDSKSSRHESNKKDQKKVGGGDSNGLQRSKSERKDQELYKSPRARSLLDQLVHASAKPQITSPRLKRSQSYEHVKVSDENRSPRHSSSPARLGCRQSPSPKPNRKPFSSERRQPPRNVQVWSSPPTNQRRSPPTSRRRYRDPPRFRRRSPPTNQGRSPLESRSPTRRGRPPVDSRSGRSPEPRMSHSGNRRFPSRENNLKSTSSSPPPRFSGKQPQQRIMSPSPERRFNKSGRRSPTNHSRHQAKAPYAKKGTAAGRKTSPDSPWYACSSPPRSGNLVKDHTEDKLHGDLEKALQPLVFPVDELSKLTSQLEAAPSKTLESHVSKSTEIKQLSSDTTNNVNTSQPKVLSAPAKEESQPKSPPLDARQISARSSSPEKRPPGLHIPSSLPAKSRPHAEMASRSLKNTQRQVTSSPTGSLKVTVKDSGGKGKAAPTDITAKLRGEQLGRPRQPPGLAPPGLTKIKATAQVAQKTKGPREVFPDKQMPHTQAAKHAVTQQQQTSQQQRSPRVPQQPASTPVLQQQQARPPQQQAGAEAAQPLQSQQPKPSRPPQQVALEPRPGASSALRPVWKPILTHGSLSNVLVTEYTDPGDFYVQPVNTPLQKLMIDINNYMGTEEPEAILSPVCGSIVLAQWIHVDQCWYRAAIKSVAPAKEQKGAGLDLDVGVIFIDYGNQASVPLYCIKALDQRFQNVPPQAVQVSLANVKPKGSVKWTAQAVELFRILTESTQELKVFCAKVIFIPSTGRTMVDLSYKEPKGNALEEINISWELVQHQVAEYILPQGAPSVSKSAPGRASKSSSDGTGSRPQTPSDTRGQQPPHGQLQQQSKPTQQQQQQYTQPKGSSQHAASKSVSDEAPVVIDPNQQAYHQLTSQAHHQQESQARNFDNTSGTHNQDQNIKQGSASSNSQDPSVASYRKARDIPQQQQNEPKQPQQQPVATKAKAGMTLAQTIAAQAAETFHDDTRSVCSSKSSGSMQTARGTASSSTTSMQTAYDGRSGSVTSQGSLQHSGSQQSRGTKRSGDSRAVASGAVPKKQPVKQYPQLAPRQLSTRSNDSIQVAMSHIIHPHEFYVHLISQEIRKLDFMQEELKYTYEEQFKDKKFSGFNPDVGMMGVSKYSLDDMWYRIQVVALEERTAPVLSEENRDPKLGGMQYQKTLMAQIWFVDFGNTEWVAASSLKPLHNNFFGLPAQAIKCSLAHINPEDPSKVPYFKLADNEKPPPTTNNTLSTTTSNDDDGSSQKNFCDVCCNQAKNKKEYNDHLNSNDHMLAFKMARFCDASKSEATEHQPAHHIPFNTHDYNQLFLHKAESQSELGGWSQIAVDIFKQLAPCENHRMLGMLVKQVTEKDEAVPLILSYHENEEEIVINQELVNLGVATSTRFQKKVIEATTYNVQVQSDINQDFLHALQAWNQPKDHTGYGDSVITTVSYRGYQPFPIASILTVPEQKETNTPTNCQLSMAMETWNVKESGGYGAVEGEGVEDDGEAEMEVMDKWDPKTSDYYSERNSLEVDDEDITAAVGYSHVHDRKFCKFYMRNQKCYRGDQCPYEHPEPGEDLRDRIPVFYAPTNHSPTLPAVDSWIAVEVTSLYNAFHFWVQMPLSEMDIETIQGTGMMKPIHEEDSNSVELHSLEKTINECCKVSLRSEDPNILRALGEVVIAKYSRNKRWYRARIIDYDETEPCLKVFYVDYGNAEWLPRADIRTPKSEFLHLPFQAVECFLYGVEPIKGKEDLARRNLEPLIMDKILIAHVVSATGATNTMEIQLYNTSGKLDISICQYLQQHNFAKEIRDMRPSRNRPRRISELDEPDSVSCHEMGIPG